MDFYSLDNYTYLDLEYLITSEVEENIHLDYKASGALSKEPKKRQEITKDVSAFANSDGGIIIYGISEKNISLKVLAILTAKSSPKSGWKMR